MAQRKRAAGAGRKAQGEFSELRSVMSVRMPDAMRETLTKAAQKNGRSVTQELLRRLDWSFDEDKKNYRDRAVKAFCFLFSELAQLVHWNIPDWQTNPFLFKAFKIGVPQLLEAFEPSGKIKAPQGLVMGPPDRINRVTRSPAALAEYAVSVVLANYSRQSPSHRELDGPAKRLESITGKSGLASEIMQTEENTYYGMDQARRDLSFRRGRKS
jgi:hypothetical protein